MNVKLEKVAEALRKRGFKAVCCATGAEARDYVMKEAETARSVGFGGSVTVKSLGLVESMAAAGKEILRHGDPTLTPERKAEVMRRELTCDLFLLSANALTLDGRLVNIDGNGNRVAAITWGPKHVVFVIGMNKVAQTVEAALARARSTAAPINAQRFEIKTPCQADGCCHNCNSPDSICSYVHFLRNSRQQGRHIVVLVGEDLGY